MKYQTYTVCFNEIAPHIDSVTPGWDRLSHTPDWPELAEFRANAIATGGLDRYWGEHDKVEEVSALAKRVILTYNTLEAATGWYDLVIDADGYPIHPTCLGCRIVELNDDGTPGNEVKASIRLTPDVTP